MSIFERLQPKRLRRNASTRNMPTPPATEKISTGFGTPGICPASTCRSGSATVTIAPIIKHEAAISQILLLLASCTPTCSPIGIIAISAPSVKKPIPSISRSAPVKNSRRSAGGIGVIVTQSRKTIAVIGKTAESDSPILPLSFGFNIHPSHFITFLFYFTIKNNRNQHEILQKCKIFIIFIFYAKTQI